MYSHITCCEIHPVRALRPQDGKWAVDVANRNTSTPPSADGAIARHVDAIILITLAIGSQVHFSFADCPHPASLFITAQLGLIVSHKYWLNVPGMSCCSQGSGSLMRTRLPSLSCSRGGRPRCNRSEQQSPVARYRIRSHPAFGSAVLPGLRLHDLTVPQVDYRVSVRSKWLPMYVPTNVARAKGEPQDLRLQTARFDDDTGFHLIIT